MWLARDSSPTIAVYVVWSSQLGATEANVSGGASLVPDPRARHYWDADKIVGAAFDSILSLPVPAWDTWMLFAPTAAWRGRTPPAPAWWEHQLNVGPPERHLDPARFTAHAESLDHALNPLR